MYQISISGCACWNSRRLRIQRDGCRIGNRLTLDVEVDPVEAVGADHAGVGVSQLLEPSFRAGRSTAPRLVPLAPPNEIITSPPAALNRAIDASIVLTWLSVEPGSACRPPGGEPSGDACRNASVSRGTHHASSRSR